ncbi:putative low complexity [Cryptosporidium sp. chipmunk genotype I]|uniref:putative low complexity n=1 Tax=Cryptosporidium sp. chipmunk genotype I TaxID=1280935 RepID=UPI00351A9B7C|nr:putative low complexity [Cryptosporidium sp. chipmunk genotype I]
MKESSYIGINDASKQEYSEKKVENDDSRLSKSIQFVVNEVSSLLNYSSSSKTKEQDIFYPQNESGHLKVIATDVHKTIQVSSAIKLRSNNPLLLSLTALLSNPHHTKYLNLMTENIIEGFSESQTKKFNVDELGNKSNDLISKESKNAVINLIASNLQYYLFEGRATNIVINDLVVTLMKAYSSEKTPNKVFDINWETNNQVFIEARDWCVIIGPKECIFPKTCYELRELLNKKGIKLKSYFENANNSENTLSHKINPVAGGVELQDTNHSSIDELDNQYFEKLSYSKLKEYKSNNIPNYSRFEQIKKFISVQYPNLKTFFYSPGSCIYINGNDVVTFLDILKKSSEEKKMKENESKHNLAVKKISNSTNPYWFLKDTKRIISNFPVKDTVFKASTCDCNFIHNPKNKAQGFYELNIEGLFLPNSLYVILNGFKLLCPDIFTCSVSIESLAEPPFFPNEINNPILIWEKLIPLLNATVRSISPTLVELANQLKPYTKVYFKNSRKNAENIKNNQEKAQAQTLNYTIPFFSLPRKRLNPTSQLQNLQKNYPNVNCRNSSQNFVTIGNSAINNSTLSQIQPKNIHASNSTFSNILLDLSTSNGIYDSINAQVGSMFTHGIGNFPNLTGSSSSVENQALLALSQNNTQNNPPLLPSSGIRSRTPNSVSANIQWLNFKGIGFSSHTNSNYVSLSTPMGKQLLHRIGTINPIQRLEQTQNLVGFQTKSTNVKGLNSNQINSSIESFSTKIFEETALCFIGFDFERLDYFTARAAEEGAKVIKLSHLEKEYIKQYSKFSASKEMNISNFIYSWLNVTRFYCVLELSKLHSDETNFLNFSSQNIFRYFEFQQFVSLEWFLTSCFERRSLDPDMFTPICRPAFSIQSENKLFPTHFVEDDFLVIIIENFPHMNKIYNSSKEGQELLSNAIWGNCIQRILKSIYGPNITNMREISSVIERNKSKWERGFPSSVIIVPCNLMPYKSSLTNADPEFSNSPVSALYGPSKCQFFTDLEVIKNYFSNYNPMEVKNFEEILHIVTPSWVLDSCSKRTKIDYKEYEIIHSNSVVQMKRRRRKTKVTAIDGKNNIYKEEVCFFYKKDNNSNIHNIVPPQGPWPLWGWNVYIIDSIKQSLSENLKKKLKEVGAIYTYSTISFENVIEYSEEQIKKFLNKIEDNCINLIVCNDFLDFQLIKKIEGINKTAKDEVSYHVLKGINIVGESWINMVYGTRTLHPFGCKFYFNLNLGFNKNLDYHKDFNLLKVLESYSTSKKTEKNENYNGEKDKADSCKTLEDKFGECDGETSIILGNSKYIKANDENKTKENKVTKVHFGEHHSAESIEYNRVQDSSSSENKSNKQKRRRTINKDFHLLGSKIHFECLNGKTIEKNSVYYDTNTKNDYLKAFDNVNQIENEFLVPLSLSFMSNWSEDKNKDCLPLFFSSHTPIRKGYEAKEIHSNTPTESQINWINQFNNIEDLIDYNTCPIGSNDDFASQTDKTTTFQKTVEESENYHPDNTNNSYSPILCPIIPVNLNY